MAQAKYKCTKLNMYFVDLQIADDVIPVKTEQPSENDNKISATTTVRIVKKRGRRKAEKPSFFLLSHSILINYKTIRPYENITH
jgi:hypothetical protein